MHRIQLVAALLAIVALSSFAGRAKAQTFNSLASFNGTNGANPHGSHHDQRIDALWNDQPRRNLRHRHGLQPPGDRRHSRRARFIQLHRSESRRISLWQFDAQRLDSVWDDQHRRGRRLWRRLQYPHDRWHAHGFDLVQRFHDWGTARRQPDAQRRRIDALRDEQRKGRG